MGEKTFLWSELETCYFSVKTVVTFDVVLYHNQSSVNCILLNYVLGVLSDINIVWMKIFFSSIKSKELYRGYLIFSV